MVIFWVSVLALSILLYVLLDGFDLGVGVLFGLTRDEHRRRAMMSAVAPVWDGNETWLVVAGVVLWGAFPVVYATLFSALYLPLLLMLAGLILRGVAFEFRNKTQRLRWVWDAAFSGGSLVAAFMQGMMVGALVEGLPISHGEYAGGEFGWLSPFAVICGVGLSLGYTLLGACWLIRKCNAEVRASAYRLVPYLSLALLVFVRFRGGIRHVRDHVLALYDPVLDHRRSGRGTAYESRVHVLGRRPVRLSPHAHLYSGQLRRVPRQGPIDFAPLLKETHEFLPPHHWDSRSQFWGGRWESNQRIEDGVRAIQEHCRDFGQRSPLDRGLYTRI